MNTLEILASGKMPPIIGTTPVDDNIVKFRCTYPSECSSGDDSTELFNTYKEGKEWFDANKEDIGDVHFFACLLPKDYGEQQDDSALDEELIESFYEEQL